jgi:hypothetical protein
MTLEPTPSFYNLIHNLELHPKLKQLLAYSLKGKKPPKDLFDVTSYYYYSAYVKPKLTKALKDENPFLRIYISPNYLIYDIGVNYKQYRRTYVYTYIIGIDNDKLFVNRIHGTPDTYKIETIKLKDHIEIRFTDDNIIHNIMGYEIDLGDLENITIENITPNPTTNIRVQGDLVLQLEQADDQRLSIYIGTGRILDHIEILMIDLVNRILLEHGLTPTITGLFNNLEIYLPSVAPRKNDIEYLNKLVSLLYRELKELFGEQEIELIEFEYSTAKEIRIKSTYNCALICDREGGGLENPYNHLLIRVACNALEDRPNTLFHEILNETIEAIKSAPLSNFEFNIGNHFIKLTNAKSLSFSYRPSRQPITLNEHYITIRNPLTFIVYPNSTLELQHPEHGIKTITFKNNYIIRFTHVNVHEHYTRERNRVILKKLKL